jgi:hypothetical protein
MNDSERDSRMPVKMCPLACGSNHGIMKFDFTCNACMMEAGQTVDIKQLDEAMPNLIAVWKRHLNTNLGYKHSDVLLQISKAKVAELQAKLQASEAKTSELQAKLQASEAKTSELQAKLQASEAKTSDLQASEAKTSDLQASEAKVAELQAKLLSRFAITDN